MKPRLRVVDLFSWEGGWSAAFADRDHDVLRIDIDPRCRPDLLLDVLEIRGLNGFDVILASPPCQTFSVASIGKHWGGGKDAFVPITPQAAHGLRVARAPFELIHFANPRVYAIENPRGLLRKLAPDWLGEPVTTTYCRWGERRMKPTDIWTNVEGEWPLCANGGSDHDAAPRGAKTGTQGIKGAAARGVIPYRLSMAMCLAAERDGNLPPMEDVSAAEVECRGEAA